MLVKDLKPNKRNPRKISEKKKEALRKSMQKFGDLSGFVYNRQSKSLISGHMRKKTIPENASIKIEVRHDTPTDAMTVAEGHVLIGKERFKYREVDASPEWEMEAMLAANKHGGEWDHDILKLNLNDFPAIDLELTGFDIPELQAMNIEFNPSKIAAPIMIKEETDEQYVRNTKKTNEEIDTERPPSLLNYEKKEKEEPGEMTDIDPFAEVEETQRIVDKRYVIIVDCKDDEHKKELKEKLRPLIDEAGAKIF